jgi:hypothetical protein
VIVLRLAPDEGADGFVQPLAGESLWTASPLAPAAAPAPRQRDDAAPGEAVASWRVVATGVGSDLGSARRVEVRMGASGERVVEYDDGEQFWIAADGGAIVRMAPGSRAAAAALERALGAPLALALARRGVHLLHASALLGRGRVIACTADSGVGKSTFAGGAAGSPELGLRRVADDVLPVRLATAAEALPHFPQLKLAPEASYGSAEPARLPLAALVELERRDDVGAPRLRRLAPAAGALLLSRATVAARLFDATLLAPHFEACAEAARGLVVARLSYASGPHRLGEALALLADQIG